MTSEQRPTPPSRWHSLRRGGLAMLTLLNVLALVALVAGAWWLQPWTMAAAIPSEPAILASTMPAMTATPSAAGVLGPTMLPVTSAPTSATATRDAPPTATSVTSLAATTGTPGSITPSATTAPPTVTLESTPIGTKTASATATGQAGSPLTAAEAEARVVARTNYYRQQFGCQPLTIDKRLTASAQRHSEDMALHDLFDHVGSDGSSPSQRITAAGYKWSLAAENLAAGYTSPEEVVDAWFNEVPPNDGHRRNLLNCALRQVGVGYYDLANDGGKYTFHTYWTQDLATPSH